MIVKQLTLLTLGILFFNVINAQNKIERFCKISISRQRHSVEEVDVDYGSNDNFKDFKDSLIIVKLFKVKQYKNQVDAFNYLSTIGWQNISTVFEKGFYNNNEDRIICMFKKTFEKDELKN